MSANDNSAQQAPILSVEDLSITFHHQRQKHTVVDRVSFDIRPGQIVGLIGESGSGKTLTALSILRLLPRGANIQGGTITFAGLDLLSLDDRAMRATRGDRIGMIFQDPMTTMNPVLRVGTQVAEPLVLHRGVSWQSAREQACQRLRQVHIPDAEDRARAYPQQFSGGMLQRAVAAMALTCQPELMIADEPTTALDVTIQAQILRLLREIRQTENTAILLITHDLGVIAEICDWVIVMYAGRVLEQGSVESIFEQPAQPYTRALLRAMPRLDTDEDLVPIPGQMPASTDRLQGCRFADRCEHCFAACSKEPPLIEVGNGHSARCWLAEERR